MWYQYSLWPPFKIFHLNQSFDLKQPKLILACMYLFAISGLWRDQKTGKHHSSKTLDTTMACSSSIIIASIPIQLVHPSSIRLPAVCQKIDYTNPSLSTGLIIWILRKKTPILFRHNQIWANSFPFSMTCWRNERTD